MSNQNKIAIVGMSGRFPGAANNDELWQILRVGGEPLRAKEQDADKPEMAPHVAHTVRANCTLPDIDKFDAAFFGFNPREAEMTDPQHRIFLECAWEALENAGLKAGDQPRPVGVFAGAGMSSYIFGQIEHDAQILDAFPSIIATDKDFISTRVSFKLNLTGPSMTIQCACSTSMVSIHLACQSLLAGECDAAIAGGVAAAAPQHDTYKYMPGGMLSPDGRCRPFDANGHGTVFADGAAVIVLMRLGDALEGGYPIRAVILGSAVNNDGGQKPGYTAPTLEGQVRVVRQALDAAEIDASALDFIEAHGTGTVLGDAIEIGALTKVMRAASKETGGCTLGSIKSNIGHLLAAAGAAGVVKTVLALEHREIPPCANFENPNPDLDFATSPFTVNTVLKPWDNPAGGIRRAGVSSFGVGGTNAHIVLEEAPRRTPGPSRRKWHVLPLSARTGSVLPAVSDRYQSFLETADSTPFADIVFTAQAGRRAFEYRKAVIAADAAGAAAALAVNDASRVFTRKTPARPAKIAFMFTGQGSQYPGMGAGLYADEPAFAQAVNECLAFLSEAMASDLRALAFTMPQDLGEAAARLQRTETAQLALFIMHYALTELLKSFGIVPDFMIGHSIGEYAAACISGVLPLRDALSLVAERGRLMGTMEPGAMLSVAAGLDELPPLPSGLSIAAVNAPKLVVVAGPEAAVDAYEAVLSSRGTGHRRLNTSHAFHSAMMEPMLETFQGAVAALPRATPLIPYVSSLTGAFVSPADVAAPDFWTRQIREAVRFADGLETLAAAGATVFIEAGPGRSLTALARQCGLPSRGIDLVGMLPEPGDAPFQIAAALGRLWLAGANLDWRAFHKGDKRQRVALPTYPFDRQSYWIDPAGKMAAGMKTTGTANKIMDPAEWFYAPAWRQMAPVAGGLSLRPPRKVLLVGGAPADALAALLRSQGDETAVLRDCEPRTLDMLVAGWSGAAQTPDRIIHLTSIEPLEDQAPGEGLFWRRQERDALGLLRLLQTVSAISEGKPLDVHIVSSGLYDVTGADVLIPANAPLVVFARVAPQELPHVTCRVLDIEPALVDAAARIETHLAASGPTDTVVALRGRRAWRLDFERIARPADGLAAVRAPRHRGVYLITGGLGKVGLVHARYLARNFQACLVLTGRADIPGRAYWDNVTAQSNPALFEKIAAIKELEALGAEILPVSADVSDVGSMSGVLAAAIARFGAIHGFIHCAGVTTAARVILDTGRPEFEQNLRSKALGLDVLELLLGDQKLDFGIVVSSLSATLGGLGHMAYAAANAYADAAVLRHNQLGRAPWISVGWDAWKFEKAEADQTQAILNKLDLSLDETEGERVIGMLMAMDVPDQVIVSTASLSARVSQWIERRAARRDPAENRGGGKYQRPETGTPFADPEGPIETRLAEIWREALGLDRVGRDDDFFDIGGHSLMAIQIMARIRESFGVDFPIDRAAEASRLTTAAKVISALQAQGASREGQSAVPRMLAAE